MTHEINSITVVKYCKQINKQCAKRETQLATQQFKYVGPHAAIKLPDLDVVCLLNKYLYARTYFQMILYVILLNIWKIVDFNCAFKKHISTI